MTERYTHYVGTSGGSSEVTLAFGDDGAATVKTRTVAMGSPRREFCFQFRVRHFSDRYGILLLTRVTRLDPVFEWSAEEINHAMCGFHEENDRMFFWGVGYEFIRLPGGESHVPNDPHLMDFWNATWNPRMDLILIGRVSVGDLIEGGVDADLTHALAGLDKLKFSRANDGEASR